MIRMRRLLAGAAALAIATGGIGIGAIGLSATAAQAARGTVTDAVFEWSVNDESTGGAYFGSNFFVAGEAGDAGSARTWNADDVGQLFPVGENGELEDGNTSIVYPNGRVQTWDERARTQDGTQISGTNPQRPNNHTGAAVRIEGGTGRVDPETDTGTISWEGSFTFVYYSGMTYWTISDPTLEVVDGKGKFTGTFSGYGADMDDFTKWEKLDAVEGEIITLQTATVDLTEDGFEVLPDYLGVATDTQGRNEQNRSEEWWGAFPQDWIDFNVATGQDSYWYSTSGGATSIQPRKVTNPVTVTYDWEESTDPLAVSRYSTFPEGYGDHTALESADEPGDEAWAVSLDNLQNWSGQELSARVEETPLGAAPPGAQVSNPANPAETVRPSTTISDQGTATAAYDISDLPIGTHLVTFFIGDDQVLIDNTATIGKTTTEHAMALTIVAAPDGAPADLDVTGRDSTSATVRWGHTPRAQPPTYLLRAKARGGSEITRPIPGRYDSGTIWNLAPATTYDVTVEARIADVLWGPSASDTITTSAAPPTPVGGNPGDDDPADDAPDSPDDEGPGDSSPTFYWGLNHESNSGAFFGGCNFLAAGAAGDTGSSRIWTESDGFYQTSAGNVSVEKPNASGQWSTPSWGSKCQDRNGRTVSTAQHIDSKPWTETRIKITGGELERDDSGAVTVQWTGSFTVAYYGGMTYWFASDPRLELDAEGNGRVTATASGFGADMFDTTKWNQLTPRTITLADLKGVDMAAAESDGGFEKTPEYLGVSYSGRGGSSGGDVGGQTENASAQAPRSAANENSWGSFPSSFVDFQNETGQFSYWFSSDGARDPYKPATPLAVGYTGDFDPPPPGGGGTDPNASSSGSSSASGSGSGSGSGSAKSGSPGQAAAGADADARPASQAAGEGLDFGELSPLNPWVWGLSGATVAAIGGLNWAVWSFIRRRIGLDPRALL